MISYFYLFIVLLILFVSVIIYINATDRKRISDKVIHFDLYLTVLEYHMKKAYDIIYKDQILIYSLEATKINDDEFNIATKQFALLVLKMLGPNLKDEFIELYGDEETLIFNLIEYFNNNFENDQIREKAQENVMNNDT